MNVKQKLLVLAVLAGGVPGIASAGGIYVYEIANSGDIGYGSAGVVVRAQDASTVFTNPAGMTRFKETNTIFGVSPLYIHAPFDEDPVPAITGTGNGVEEVFSGAHFAYVRPLNDKWTFGVSAQNYFGLLLDWGTRGVTRYDSTEAAIIAPQVQPTLAYKINDAWSVGAGVAVTLGVLEDKLKVDRSPATGDGSVKYEDTDWTVQLNVGVMYEPSEDTRIGVRYLSQSSLDWEDTPEFSDFDVLELSEPVNLELKFKMPQSIMTGIWHRVSDRWAVLGSLGWDEWSEFQHVDIQAFRTSPSDPYVLSTRVNLDFKDTWHLGIGAEYQASEKRTYTMGVSWDSEMSDDADRLIELPMGTQWRAGGGFKYAKRDDLTLGGGLSILYMGDTPVKPTPSVAGEYKDIYILFASFNVNWK